MVPALAALLAGIAGAALARAAFTLTSSDEAGDWRDRDRRMRARTFAAVIAVSMASAGAAAALAPTIPFAVCAASFAAVAPGLALVDIAVRRLPFLYIGIAAAIAIGALSFTPDLGYSLVTALAVAVGMIALALISKGGAGGGDIALAGAAALTLTWATGWWLAACAVTMALLAAGLIGFIGRLKGMTRLPAYGLPLLITWWLAYLLSI